MAAAAGGRAANADIPVVIFAGGLGTRLREETERVPKPMVRIGDEPLLWHIMKLYGHYGFRRFVLCLGYRSEVVKQYFLTFREHVADLRIDLSGAQPPRIVGRARTEPWDVVCAETGLLTGTGGRLKRVREYVDADTFMCTYGDGIGAVDLQALLDHHRSHDRVATVTGVRPGGRYGEMEIDGDAVLEFNEKPASSRNCVSGGFFVFDRKVFDYLTDEDDLVLEREPMRKLARDNELSVYEHHDYWLGMDTYRDLTQLNDLWLAGEAPWRVWT
ncbi:glucose-1-phosphate cytidylyltransferase [Actinomycetospora termitidis]|uniref:Glucose-1-phosphate cytidylyltransferase n=1 Tax=Actinomycetospora termitidis TaxID=3053470 RepID=A0ABT7MIW4_9PSEU|nr:glucose-1-phosphate cytidylyltransferase [Actinomycetospora sp. Odt1-22]MDL5160139.1 glucose-1-phosphate cytidylyltransferase [Actinomycetospora sp. Odt1-22]